MMTRYQVIISYDGSGFSGSQRQAKSRTVQSEIERALIRLGWQGNTAIFAGRTDSGVHASGQVAAFDFDWNHPPEELVFAINANLPADIVVNEAKVVHNNFHPRFDALSRRYCYRLFSQALRNPLRERYVWRVWPVVDDVALHDAASLFLGEHDFSAFGSPPKQGNSTIRTVLKSSWQFVGDEWIFEVEADGFLYRMVRKLVHTQVAIGQGRISVQAIADALGGMPRGIPGGLAPACGLTLVEVTYPVVKDLPVKTD